MGIKIREKNFWHHIKKANLKYRMIESGDTIAVGISGGKDSLVLLYGLSLLLENTSLSFKVIPLTVDLGWEIDWTGISDYCRSLGFQHRVVPSNIGKIVFDVRQEKNPCALCANLRAGALHREARLLGCNKVALAHHLDDAVTTLFLSMMFEGQLRCFKPVTYLSRSDLWIIRPLIYVEEKSIVSLTKQLNLPVVKNPCPRTGFTNREKVKRYVQELDKSFPGSIRRILKSLENVNTDSLWIRDDLGP